MKEGDLSLPSSPLYNEVNLRRMVEIDLDRGRGIRRFGLRVWMDAVATGRTIKSLLPGDS